MSHQSLPESGDISATLAHLTGAEIRALAMVCVVGEGNTASVAAYITPNAAVSALFRHAVEMEEAYSDSLTSFDDDEPPFYGQNEQPLDLVEAAQRLGVDRLMCVITLDAHGRIAVARDYDGIEMTLIEVATIQFGRFKEILDGVMTVAPRTLQ